MTVLSVEQVLAVVALALLSLVVCYLFVQAMGELRQSRESGDRSRTTWQIFLLPCLSLAALAMVIVAFLAALAWPGWFASVSNPDAIIAAVSTPYAIPLIVSAGIGFYWLRCRIPFLCGLFEVIFSLFAISCAVYISRADSFAKIIGLLGGIYILARGLDNMDKYLKDRSPTWSRFLRGKAASGSGPSPAAANAVAARRLPAGPHSDEAKMPYTSTP